MLLFSEILCTEKSGGYKLCRQVESMRQQLEEINAYLPQLRKVLREQESLGLVEKTTSNGIAVSGTLQNDDEPEPTPKQKVVILYLSYASFYLSGVMLNFLCTILAIKVCCSCSCDNLADMPCKSGQVSKFYHGSLLTI